MDKSKLTRFSVGSRLAIACAFLTCVPLTARAQVADTRNIEIGGGVGTVGSWWVGPFSGGDVRVTVPVNRRGDVETLVGLSNPRANADGFVGFYGVQFRQHFRKDPSTGFEPFATYGGIGVFYRDRDDSMVTPPLIGLLGGGVERRVTARVRVRVDVQAIVALVLPVGVRVAAGVSVPIGQLR